MRQKGVLSHIRCLGGAENVNIPQGLECLIKANGLNEGKRAGI